MNEGPVNFGPLFVVSVTIFGSYLIWTFATWLSVNVHAYSPWLLVVFIIIISWAIERVVTGQSVQSQDDE